MNFHQKLVVYYILDYFGILFHSGHKLCAYRIHIVGPETFEGIYFEKYSEGLRYCKIIFSLP